MEYTIPPVMEYRIEIERDGAWWDVTGFVTRYTTGEGTLYVREALPVPVPARMRVSWQQTLPAAAWDDPAQAPLLRRWGIKPDQPFNAEIISTVDQITTDPPPLFDLYAPAPLTVTWVED